jgi:fibronectin type 3 domain-containing protein
MKKNAGLVISILFICLALVALYEIAVMARIFANNDTTTDTRQILRGSSPGTEQVTLIWDVVPDATSYNVYWSDSSGVKKYSGNKVSTLKNSINIDRLKHGTTYYFVVTAVNESGESKESKELSYKADK